MNPMSINLASSITKAASQQTYYTIRFLVDRERVEDAYRAYAYFRWLDDILDADEGSMSGRLAFLERQKSLLENSYRREPFRDASPQENMLVELIDHNPEENSGLHTYLRDMMRVMEFDARRRGRLISQTELSEYTGWLASAVIEALHYFIGHDDFTPHDETRYMAVSAAHITHMLRDAFEDVQAGYYNVPSEVLKAHHIDPQDVQREAYRQWVKSRVQQARHYFEAGKLYFHRVQNVRARLAGVAYISRFEWLLDTIEREGYYLRPQYTERKSLGTGLQMGWQTLSSMIYMRRANVLPRPAVSHPLSEL